MVHSVALAELLRKEKSQEGGAGWRKKGRRGSEAQQRSLRGEGGVS